VGATGALKPGPNQANVEVTNAWVNRLIRGPQLDAKTMNTFTDVKPYNTNSPLLPSGYSGHCRFIRRGRTSRRRAWYYLRLTTEILPIRHGIHHSPLVRHSPTLAERVPGRASEGV